MRNPHNAPIWRIAPMVDEGYSLDQIERAFKCFQRIHTRRGWNLSKREGFSRRVINCAWLAKSEEAAMRLFALHEVLES